MSTIAPVTIARDGVTATFTRYATFVRVDATVPPNTPEFVADPPAPDFAPADLSMVYISSSPLGQIVQLYQGKFVALNLTSEPYAASLVYPAEPMDVGDPSAPTVQPTVNAGAAPVDSSTPVGFVRILIGDTDPVDVVDGVGSYVFFGDTEIESMLTRLGDRPHRVAANFIRQIALSQTLLLKKFSSADLTTDGPAITRALRQLALDIAKEGDELEEEMGGASSFELVAVGGVSVATLGLTIPAAIAEEAAARYRGLWDRVR